MIVFAFRVLASIPVSVADIDKIQTIFEGSDFLSLLNIFSGSLLTGAFIFLSMVLSHFYNEPVLKVLTMIIGANFVIASFTVVQNALLKRKMAVLREFFFLS